MVDVASCQDADVAQMAHELAIIHMVWGDSEQRTDTNSKFHLIVKDGHQSCHKVSYQ